MGRFKARLAVVLINAILVLVPLAAVEGYYRYFRDDLNVPANALWQRFQPYIMFTMVARAEEHAPDLLPAVCSSDLATIVNMI